MPQKCHENGSSFGVSLGQKDPVLDQLKLSVCPRSVMRMGPVLGSFEPKERWDEKIFENVMINNHKYRSTLIVFVCTIAPFGGHPCPAVREPVILWNF